MPRPTAAALLLLLALHPLDAAAAPAASPAPAAPVQSASALEHSLLPSLVVEGVAPWTLEERMRRYHVPGVSIALIQDGRIAWARGYGVLDLTAKTAVTAKTLFQATSLTKAVTAMAVLRQADQGKLSLVAPVNSLLKSWKLPDGPFTNSVTLERILNHTAGLTVAGFAGYPVGATLPTLLEILNGHPPATNPAVRADAEPGTNFRYSGGGYEIAQQVLIDTTGQAFPALVRASVLGPLAMEDSYFEQPLSAELASRAATGYSADGVALQGKWHVYPELAAVGLWTTASDLARLVIAVQQSYAGAVGAPLSKDMAKRMLTGQAADGALGFSAGNALGLFVDQRGKGTFSHITLEQPNGTDGFRALLLASTEGGYGLVVMTNGDGGNKLADEIARGAAQLYGWTALKLPRLKRSHVSEEQLRKLAGRYRFGSDSMLTVTVSHGALRAQPVLGEAFDLYGVEGGEFVRVDPASRYTFDAAGVVVKTMQGDQTGVRASATETVPLQLLLSGNVSGALAAYRNLKQSDGTDPAVGEIRLNDIGYELKRISPDKAMAIFQLNTELYPDSANSWDSLAEEYLGVGKKGEALRCYRRVLDVVTRDSHLPADIKSMLMQNAERKIHELEGG